MLGRLAIGAVAAVFVSAWFAHSARAHDPDVPGSAVTGPSSSKPALTEPPRAPLEVRDAYATLLGLDLDGEKPVRDGATDIYRSSLDDADAPRLLTRMEVNGSGCRVRTTSALQSPGKWAVLSLTMTDLLRVEKVVAYASVDDLIFERNPLRPGDAAARQLVLEGERLQCITRLSLEGGTTEPASTCHDRLDISMQDEAQARRAQDAIALMAEKCQMDVLRP